MNKKQLLKTLYRKQFIWYEGSGFYHWNSTKNHWYKILDEDKKKFQIVKYFDDSSVIGL